MSAYLGCLVAPWLHFASPGAFKMQGQEYHVQIDHEQFPKLQVSLQLKNHNFTKQISDKAPFHQRRKHSHVRFGQCCASELTTT
jgi:hypothetical protein